LIKPNKRNVAILIALFAIMGCTKESVKMEETAKPRTIEESINKFAESYVMIMLGMDIHEPGYVDAYYGPQEYKEDAGTMQKTLEELKVSAKEVIAGLSDLDVSEASEIIPDVILPSSFSE